MKTLITLTLLLIATMFAAACGTASTDDAAAAQTVKSGSAGNNLTATIASKDGVLRKGKQDFTLTFTDASGKPVDVGSASLNFHMPAMGTMAVMNNPSTLTTTSTPGVYAGKTDLEMSGEWQAQIKYDGPAGTGSANLPIVAQ